MPLAWHTRSHDNGLEMVDHFLESGDPLLALGQLTYLDGDVVFRHACKMGLEGNRATYRDPGRVTRKQQKA